MKIKHNLRVCIDAEAMERIWHWTDLASGEFSCLGQVTDDLLAHDIQLFDQVCTAGSTELDQQALAKFLCKHNQPEKVRLWCHSHARFGVFWSPQDETCIDGLANESFLLSIVVNKKRDVKVRLDIWHPFRVTLDDLPLEIRLPKLGLARECEALFELHVTEQHAVMPTGMMRQHIEFPRQLTQKPLERVAQGWPAYDDDDFGGWGRPR